MRVNNLELKEVMEREYEFLYELMNNESIMKRLNETCTSLEDWKSAILYWKNDSDEENYIIYNNNKPIGWIGINNLDSSDREVYIKILAILPENQRRGIGGYAVKNMINYLKGKGFKKLSLYTDKDNDYAQRCYIKCGFKIETTLTDKMANGKNIERYKMSIVL